MRSNIVPYYIWYGVLRNETCSDLDDQKPNTNGNAVAVQERGSKEKVPDKPYSVEADPWLEQSQDNEQGPQMSAWTKLGTALADVIRRTKTPMAAPRLRLMPP